MLKRLYASPENKKAACRQHLHPQSKRSDLAGSSSLSLCLAHVCPWLSVELVRCAQCTPGHPSTEGMVIMCPVPTKATRESLATSSGSNLKPNTTFASFPELWAFLTSCSCPDGSKRLPGKLSLSCECGLWTLLLTDPHTSLYACLTGSDLDDLVLMAEARLAESTMPWRASRYGPKPKA
jgi:hypothetical protein